MKTIPFDIEKAKNGAKIVTRSGRNVNIFTFTANNISSIFGPQPIIGKVEGQTDIYSWSKDGFFMYPANNSPFDLQLKVEPAIRPWKPEEVPIGALMTTYQLPVVILGVSCDKEVQYTSGINHITSISLSHITNWKYSLDQGKTWLPCGVEE